MSAFDSSTPNVEDNNLIGRNTDYNDDYKKIFGPNPKKHNENDYDDS